MAGFFNPSLASIADRAKEMLARAGKSGLQRNCVQQQKCAVSMLYLLLVYLALSA